MRCIKIFALTLLCCSSMTVHASVISFGNFSQFTVNKDDFGAAPAISIANSSIQITDAGSISEARSIFHNVKQDVSEPFMVTYTYRSNVPSISSTNAGITFAIQNSPNGANALGNTWYDLGYGGIAKSLALSLELEEVGRSGLYLNGSKFISRGLPTDPVIFDLGNPIHVTIAYDGAFLTQTLLDSVTNATSSATFSVDIPAIVESEFAYLGFTGSTGLDAGRRDQYISDFEFTPVPEPSTFALIGVGAILLCGLQLRRRVFSLRRS